LIPQKLILKNFLSYGEDVPPLDFSQFHVACLSGNNGQGKSALLDALTWVVWGEGRKSSSEKKADKSLLRMGQKDMQVEFEFDLEGDRYRIIRNYSVAQKSSRSSLEFQVFDPKNGKFVSLTGTSMKNTQEKIIKTLRIDYHTFINSAFILQGRIDEFSRKNTRERKEILSEILGLSHYDELVNLAKVHLKELNNNIITRESRLEYIAWELAQVDFYKEKIKELSKSYSEVSGQIKEKEEQLSKIKEKINILKHKEEQFNEIKRQIERQELEMGREQKQIELKKKEILECEKIISRKETILEKFKNYQKYNFENNEYTKKLQKVRKLEEERISLQRKIEKEKTDLIVEMRNRQDRHKDLLVKARQKAKNESILLELKNRMKEIKSLEEESEKIRDAGNKCNIELSGIKSKVEGLEKEIWDSEEKLRLLQENPEGECPLCEAKLNLDRKEKIEINLTTGIKSNSDRIKQLKKDEEKYIRKKEELINIWRAVKQKLQDKDVFQQNLSRAQFEFRESEQAEKLVAELYAEIKEVEQKITGKDYAREEQGKLKELEEKIKSIEYDETEHNQIYRKVQDLSHAPLENAKLLEAERKIDLMKETLSEGIENQQQKTLNLRDLEKKKKNVEIELTEFPSLNEKLARETSELTSDYSLKDKILEEKGGYQSKFEQCLEMEKERKEIKKELEKSRKKQDVYEKLVVAFGKNGIQALIIENTLPEIEEEANNLLAKLTTDGTKITIESLRDLKSGKIKETLDIKISDELGVRDYELYSGGEAFRIDFSLRIALSKLLTRRAGTKLRTLVMDEGFGTQDSEGLDNLVQAIQSISDDFDKILVITHLESLKNVFPVRIEVTKHPEIGSRFEIIKS